jgi:hypothetical protein
MPARIFASAASIARSFDARRVEVVLELLALNPDL